MKTYILAGAALIVAACSDNKTPKQEQETAVVAESPKTANDSISIQETDAVTSATNVANSPTFNGVIMVSPQQKATLSLTMGGKIHTLAVMPGQFVQKDKVVATIDNPEFIELQQTYLEASAQTEFLAQEFQRQSTLGQLDATSQKKVQQSKADYLSMKSRKDASKSRLQTLGIDVEKITREGIMPFLPVTAPFSGYATNIDANVGKYLKAGEPICDIINKSNLLLQLTVYEKDLPLISEGRKMLFLINGLGNAMFDAEIVSIDQSIDNNDYSIKVYARVKNNRTEFRPGMYVRARLVEE